jgi:4-diphosphocytidyl-2-C-methyl-D-erythritol kinase
VISKEGLTLLGEEKAPAKINLSLRVLGRRPDGYHELFGLMAKVGLFDEVRVWLREDAGAAAQGVQGVPGAQGVQGIQGSQGLEEVPGDLLEFTNLLGPPFEGALVGDEGFAGPRNLALRALGAYRDKTGYPEKGALIGLTKAIPKGAGLGGASTDAAAVLRILNREKRLTEVELKAMAKALGGDVPFFLERASLYWAGGIGEKLSPYHGPWPGEKVMLINPGFELSTADVFSHLGLTFGQNGSISLNASWGQNSDQPQGPPGLKGPMGARTQEFGDEPSWGLNDLEEAATRLCPALGETRKGILGTWPGPKCFGLSGSGATYWAIYDGGAGAEAALGGLADRGFWVRLVTLGI